MRSVRPPGLMTTMTSMVVSLLLFFLSPVVVQEHAPSARAGWVPLVTGQAGLGGATAVPFEHVIIDESVPGSNTKTVGDLNGDGFPDLIIAGAPPNNGSGTPLAWYEYPTWTRHVVDPRSVFGTDIQAVDIDDDGDLDIVVPDEQAKLVLWYENPRPNGASVGGSWARHVLGSADAHDVEVGDLNNDSKVDVVVRGHVGPTVAFFQGTPTAWTQVVIATAPPGEGTALGDVDRDGDLDIVQNGYWLERPDDPVSGTWTPHAFAAGWPERVATAVADINRDGRPDLLLAASESRGKLAWYEGPADPTSAAWVEHVVDSPVDYVHTFKVADMDNDGALDIAFAEMHQSAGKRVGVYFNQRDGDAWTQQVIATTGSHNMRVTDIDSDGDLDVFGVNWSVYAPHHPVEIWRNQLNPTRARGLETKTARASWTYINADNGRAPSDAGGGSFGLAIGDVTGDGIQDVASGRYFYRNPGETMTGPWPRVDLPNPNPANGPVDAQLLVDADGDGQLDIIAENLPDVYWMKAADAQGSSWTATRIGSITRTDHRNGQGYELAQMVPDGPPEVLLSGGDGIYVFQIPPDPSAGSWPVTRITTSAKEQEGIGVGDVNADGLIDVAAWTGTPGSLEIVWWLNPGTGAGDWTRFSVGSTLNQPDRVEIADVNGDGRPDVVASEEIGDPGSPTANVFWFEAPVYPTTPTWVRHPVATGFSINSLDVADVNRDGHPDLVTGEIFGTKKTTVWLNGGAGASWKAQVVDSGKESHLGARAADLDGDGDLDIVSIAYQAYRDLHVWRNDSGPAVEAEGGQ